MKSPPPGARDARGAGDARGTGSVPGSGRPPEGGNGSLLPYSRLENPMDRGACWATVHGVTKSRTRLNWLSTDTKVKQVATNEGGGAYRWGWGGPTTEWKKLRDVQREKCSQWLMTVIGKQTLECVNVFNFKNLYTKINK